MKNNTEATKDQTPKTQAEAPKAKPEPKAKAAKEAADSDGEATDRLPTSVEELKETKGGLVTYLFLSGKDKEAIAKDLAATFKLPDGHAAKIVRRITGRARFFQRAFALMAAK